MHRRRGCSKEVSEVSVLEKKSLIERKDAVTHQRAIDMIGNTPLVRVESKRPGATVYMKLEGCNPTGSLKDRTCIYLVQDMLDRQELKPGMCLLDASSGNLGCSIAYYARLLGYEALLVAGSKLTAAKKEFMEFYGATVRLLGNFTIEGNIVCREMARQNPGKYCFLDQLHNWNNPKAHYETTGREILDAVPDVALIVGSLGSGGSLLGTAQYIKERIHDVKIVAVQSASGTRLPGTASLSDGDYVTPFIDKGFRDKLFDGTVCISETEAFACTMRLRDQGIFCGIQSGGVLHVAEVIMEQQRTSGPVVILSGDSGWKNLDKLLLAKGPAAADCSISQGS